MRNRPGPGADDFDADNHHWDGSTWWTKNREFWWDGTQWRHHMEPASSYLPPAAVSPGPRRPGWWRDFWLGFAGTVAVNLILIFVINGVISSGTTDPTLATILLIMPWVLNLGALIVFAVVRAPVALGMLLAYGIAFGLALLGGILLAVICFGGGGGVP